ncbi:unnamed protein product [Ectocarpus fasciculatus]
MVINHYAVMGIQDFARGSEAKRAYHRLALVWHPDRQVNASEQRQKEAEDVFKKINEAYAILSDKARRKAFDIDLRSELLGMAGGTSKTAAGANAGPNSTDPPKRSCGGNTPDGVAYRQLMCPECGIGTAVKAGKKGGPSLQCYGCSAYFHEVYCAGCKEWGATKGRRGESSMRCACGNVFCQSRCPSCRRWNTFNGEVQGGGSRSCGFCGCKFHEAFCPGCSSWGVWEGKKGCRSLSCDCTAVFYEISCQSCGMWGSVKGRHADANNSLSCGTCGSESHEAFCPSCRQWDSYAGAKGESTLVCKSPRCRIRPPDGKKKTAAAAAQAGTSTTKFFQVYCEGCACWRSVLGDKTAIGSANIRCEGCKTDICGTTCPACGNWDQLPRQQSVGTGATRASRKKPGQERRLDRYRAAEVDDDDNGSSSRKKTHQCTSCGHEPPPSPDQGGQVAEAYSTERAHEGVGAAAQAPVAVAATVTAAVSTRAAAAVAAPKSAVVSPEVKNDKSAMTATATRGSKQPTAATEVREVLEQRPCTRDDPPAVRRKVQGSPPSVPVTTASSMGREAPPQAPTPAPVHGMSAKPPPQCNGPRREHVAEDAGLPAGSVASSDTAAASPTSVQINKGEDEEGSGSSLSHNGIADSGLEAQGDGQPVPTFCADNDDALRPAAPVPAFPAQPPPRSWRKEGRRPYPRRRPAPPFSSGAATKRGAGAAGAAGAAEAAIPVATKDGCEALASPSTGDGGVLSGAIAPHDDGGEVTHRRSGRSRRVSDRNDETQRGASIRRRRSSRQRQRRLGSSPNLSAKLAETATESSRAVAMTEETVVVERNGDAPASTETGGGHKQEGGRSARCRSSSTTSSSPTSATFTAVPRESSPPPPPGIRIGKSDEKEGGNDGTRRGEGRGQMMVHLAFCSRCQEYQSWRARWRSGGNCWRGWKEGTNGGGAVRRHCTECGDLFANVSYYPVR